MTENSIDATLQFPFQRTYTTPVQLCTLSRFGAECGHKLVASNVELIYQGNSRIYRANLHCDDYEDIADVICKIVFGSEAMSRLREELGFYMNQLCDLQDQFVPLCYGLYEGELGGKIAGCLITEYCGESLSIPLFGMSWEFKWQVIVALAEIHDAGVRHNDFSERHIVVDETGRPRIIDFDRAEPHECGQTVPIDFHTQEPDPYDFGCHELHHACQRAGAWTPRLIRYLQGFTPIEMAESPKLLATVAPDYVHPDVAYVKACEAINEHIAWLNKRAACDWMRP